MGKFPWVRPATPHHFVYAMDKGFYNIRYWEFEVMPRDGFGVPGHIPPDISCAIDHCYYVPPQYFPFLKKVGDETPELKPWMDKLIKGQLTFHDYEEMFYKNAKPLKVYRSRIPLPYRTAEEVARSPEVNWESKWYSFRQRIEGEYAVRNVFRDALTALLIGSFACQLWMTQQAVYQDDMLSSTLRLPSTRSTGWCRVGICNYTGNV